MIEHNNNHIALTRPAPLKDSQIEQATHILKALANHQRLRILCTLLHDELSVTELNTRIRLSQSALSQHLAILRHKGLVKTRRHSQTIFYAMSPGVAQRIIATLHDIYCKSPSKQV